MTLTILRNHLKILAVFVPASVVSCAGTPPISPSNGQTSEVAGPTHDEMVTALGGGNQQEVKPVQFALGGTKVSKEEAKSLEEFISEYKNQGREIFLKITGHADSIGGEAANQKISEGRAYAVKEFLFSDGHGIPKERMRASGVGSRNLLCKDTEVSAWQKDCCSKLNRRVEIVEDSQRLLQ